MHSLTTTVRGEEIEFSSGDGHHHAQVGLRTGTDRHIEPSLLPTQGRLSHQGKDTVNTAGQLHASVAQNSQISQVRCLLTITRLNSIHSIQAISRPLWAPLRDQSSPVLEFTQLRPAPIATAHLSLSPCLCVSLPTASDNYTTNRSPC